MSRNRKRRRLLLATTVVLLVLATVAGASALNSTDLNPAGAGNDPYHISNSLPAPVYPPLAESGVVAGISRNAWTTVNLTGNYSSMVVVATANIVSGDPPLITRVQNAAGSSFDLKVDRADGNTTDVTDITVHYLVIQEGAYTVAKDGIKMEAVRYTSTVTDRKASWNGESRSYLNSYTNPVVLGQVLTYNDSNFSAFWAASSNSKNPPDSTNLYVGKHVAEDSTTTRADETVGYVVFEDGTGTLGGRSYTAAVGGDTIGGVGDSPPYSYSLSGFSTVSAALLSSAAMDGNDGGWPLLYGASPLTTTSVDMAIQEDTIGDGETSVASEQVAYVVFE